MRFDPRVELALLSAGWFPDRWSGLALTRAAADFESSGRALPPHALRFLAEFAGLTLRFPNPRAPQTGTGVDLGRGAGHVHSLSPYCRRVGEDLCVVGLGLPGSTGHYLLGASGALYYAWDDISLLGRTVAEGLLRLMTATGPYRPLQGPVARTPATPLRPSGHRRPARRRRPIPPTAATLGDPVHVRIDVTGKAAPTAAESLADSLRAAPDLLDVRTSHPTPRPRRSSLAVTLGPTGGDAVLARELSRWFRPPHGEAVLLTVHRPGAEPVEIDAHQADNGGIAALLRDGPGASWP
ncbi:SUKH-3 domain-containing protein [Kitasatospora sp. NPDC058965]|uniref:effector-associated constant component EACC1 n=1 Tax=Kitasatospora sp. NPDC058965 TaxID=3346682 RepID=UPI0036A08791